MYSREQLLLQLAGVQMSIVTKTVEAYSAFEMVDSIAELETIEKLLICLEISVKSSAFYTF